MPGQIQQSENTNLTKMKERVFTDINTATAASFALL